ncbi:hypothetical protein [Nocardia sp. NPDC056100]|uniref:hypothetical protein n=1 Tax=Nocardia sp. NPDC056100 TaxID=3345712 RepID=UPI0035D64281
MFWMVLGIAGVVSGINSLNDHQVKCGGQVMHAGDRCEELRNGSHSSTRDYSEQQSSNHGDGWFELGFGVVAILGSGFVAVRLVIAQNSRNAARRY